MNTTTLTPTTYLGVLESIDPKMSASGQWAYLVECLPHLPSEEQDKINYLTNFLNSLDLAIRRCKKTEPGERESTCSVYMYSTPPNSPSAFTLDALYFAEALLKEAGMNYKFGVPESRALILIVPAKDKNMELLKCVECKAKGEHRCLKRQVEIPEDYAGAGNSCECLDCRLREILLLTKAFSDDDREAKMNIINKLTAAQV